MHSSDRRQCEKEKEFYNETVVETVTTKRNTTVYKPYSASLLLDASKSVHPDDWVEVRTAAVALASSTRNSTQGALAYGVVQWGCDAQESVPLSVGASVPLEVGPEPTDL